MNDDLMNDDLMTNRPMADSNEMSSPSDTPATTITSATSTPPERSPIMSPDDLDLVRTDATLLGADPDGFADTFYTTLFEMAPGVRSMFPTDLADQRAKLMKELTAIVTLGTSVAEGDLDRFVARTRSLGRRHVDYGAAAAHYPVVGAALVAALADTVPDWDDEHERCWVTVYRLVADAMQEGATTAPSH